MLSQRSFWDRGPVLFFAFISAVPIAVIFFAWTENAGAIWDHLRQTILLPAILNTLVLMLGTGLGTLILGVSLAWLIVFFDFPGRRILSLVLVLPMAVPAYVMGFVWIGLLDYGGSVPAFLSKTWGISPAIFPPVRSTGGVICVMTLALYPYVYLMARSAFMTQTRAMTEAARSLGFSSVKIFWTVTLPLARPWIMGGLMLVLMETLADFGTVSVFNYDTMTTLIYKVWFSFFSLAGAAQLASMLVFAVFVLLIAEQAFRGRANFDAGMVREAVPREPLRRGFAFCAVLFAAAVALLGFGIPVAQLVFWTFKNTDGWNGETFVLVRNTFLLASAAALVIVMSSLTLSYAVRRKKDVLGAVLEKIALLGYAVPGTVLAVGVFLSMVWLDKRLAQGWLAWTGQDIGRVLTGTVFAMLLAYTVRFMAVAYQPISRAFLRVTRSVEESARSLGYRGLRLLVQIEIPMIRTGLLTALMLIFVDVAKEMPITLMTRPFGCNTLAVRIFEMTSEGAWPSAALPAVGLILVGLFPVLWVVRRQDARGL